MDSSGGKERERIGQLRAVGNLPSDAKTIGLSVLLGSVRQKVSANPSDRLDRTLN